MNTVNLTTELKNSTPLFTDQQMNTHVQVQCKPNVNYTVNTVIVP